MGKKQQDLARKVIFHKIGRKDDGKEVFGVFPSLSTANMRELNHGMNGSATMFLLAFIQCCKFILLLDRLHRANEMPIFLMNDFFPR